MKNQIKIPGKRLFIALLLLILGAFLLKSIETVGFGPFTLNIYSSPSEAEAGGTKWHSTGCLVTGHTNDRLVLRAWAPSFSIVADGPSKNPVHIEVANVLPSAVFTGPANVVETKNGTNRVIDVPSVTTAPRLKWVANPADSFSFAVTSDIHSNTGFLPFMAHNVDFLVIAGDLSGVDHQAPIIAKYFQGLPVPVYTIPGNHDMEGVREKEYVTNIAPYNYYFTYGLARFIMFSDASGILWGRGVGTKSRDWLKSQLSASAPLTFLFMHRPPFHEMSDTEYKKPHIAGPPSEALRLINIISKGDVSAVFCGHIHEYHRWERNGVPYIINGEGKQGLHGQMPRYARVTVKGSEFSITDEKVGATK